MSPVLSLVTGTIDRHASLKKFVESVIRHAQLSYELLIIDAGSEPISCMPLPLLPAEARVIREWPRKTYVSGYNSAFRECRGEFVVWLNDDAEVTAGWDVAAVDFMRAHPQVGIGCMPFFDPNRPTERGASPVEGFNVSELWGLPYANFGIISRELGDKVGWFDSDLTMYGSDNSITFKVLLAGFGVAPIANARIIHHRFKDHIRQVNQASRARIVDGKTIVERYRPQIRKLNKAFWTHIPEGADCGYL